MSQQTACRSNMRQLFVGMQTFTDSNKEKFMSPNTELEFSTGELGQVRCKAWVNAKPGSTLIPDPDDTLAAEETIEAIWQGWAYEYCGDQIFASPQDDSGRVRSYSMNGFISEAPDPFYWGLLDDFGLPAPPAATLGRVPLPSQTMFLIPEDMRGPAYGYQRLSLIHI